VISFTERESRTREGGGPYPRRNKEAEAEKFQPEKKKANQEALFLDRTLRKRNPGNEKVRNRRNLLDSMD